MVNSKKVFVGVSGGVDSSVALYLIKKRGFNVTGVFIKTWHPDWAPCDWIYDRQDAMRVCAQMEVPFETLDLSSQYKNEVADYMISEYKSGRTPNPDVMCNKHVKFGGFLDWAKSKGADFIATGHYAQNINNQLHMGVDKNKDQSYFLWTLNQEQLSKILFPVGELDKKEVRKIAKKVQLPTSQKKDSQGICFLGQINIEEFLSHYVKKENGDVLDTSGQVIGRHNGAVFYTLGQRHGFEIYSTDISRKPMFVLSKELNKNTLTVGGEKDLKEKGVKYVELEIINWISDKPKVNKKYKCRFRYRQKLIDCEVKDGKVTFLEKIEKPAVGQSLVIYDGENCLGGGIIS